MQQVFGQKLLNSLLPSDTYGYCSGGLPEKIPDLTWEDLKQFHAVHYSPNNARFYSYGNLPLEEHLEAVHAYLPPMRTVDEKGDFSLLDLSGFFRFFIRSSDRIIFAYKIPRCSQRGRRTKMVIASA